MPRGRHRQGSFLFYAECFKSLLPKSCHKELLKTFNSYHGYNRLASRTLVHFCATGKCLLTVVPFPLYKQIITKEADLTVNVREIREKEGHQHATDTGERGNKISVS